LRCSLGEDTATLIGAIATTTKSKAESDGLCGGERTVKAQPQGGSGSRIVTEGSNSAALAPDTGVVPWRGIHGGLHQDRTQAYGRSVEGRQGAERNRPAFSSRYKKLGASWHIGRVGTGGCKLHYRCGGLQWSGRPTDQGQKFAPVGLRHTVDLVDIHLHQPGEELDQCDAWVVQVVVSPARGETWDHGPRFVHQIGPASRVKIGQW
jgi:hypothetical protein